MVFYSLILQNVCNFIFIFIKWHQEITRIYIIMEEFGKVNNYITYSVSNLGNVRNDSTNKILKPRINKQGYYYVNLYTNGKYKSFKIHRLVALTFIDNSYDKPCVDHINNNKLNNNMNDLRW
jgi:hypothetical protein